MVEGVEESRRFLVIQNDRRWLAGCDFFHWGDEAYRYYRRMEPLPRISVSGEFEGDYVVLARRENGALIVAPAQLGDVPVVTSLRRTSIACPSQWEGTLDDGRVLHARFRHGDLSVGLGEGIEEAVRNRGPDKALLRADVGDGFMTFEELRTYLYGLVDFAPGLEVEGEREELSILTEMS